jgi:hypothetical protein
MEPRAVIATAENITEVAHARIVAIRAKARELGDVESSDERLLGIVIRNANRYATRSHHPAETAQAAVSWAISDMYATEED